ncbi:MAG: hypothetical protein O2888_06000 [Chloroflexi bacterium]|nr:hypothetical protein [Chloroflexota bacterium]
MLGSLNANERVIFTIWNWSTTTHDFVRDSRTNAAAKLVKAITDASTQVVDPPALYSAANLRFLTSAAGRLPTLYFTSLRVRRAAASASSTARAQP